MGFLNAQQSKNETILCSLGYSNAFSGSSAALVFLGGILGSFVIGYFVTRISNDKVHAFLKACCIPVGATLLVLIFLIKSQDSLGNGLPDSVNLVGRSSSLDPHSDAQILEVVGPQQEHWFVDFQSQTLWLHELQRLSVDPD